MRVIFYIFISIFVSSLVIGQELDLLAPESEAEITQWLKFGKPKGFKELPKEKIPEKSPIILKVNEVITSTLENQWNVQIAEEEVFRQSGVAQTARGPFDPTIGADYARKWLKDTQTFGLKTGQDGQFDSVRVFLEKLTRIGTRFSLNGEVQREFNPSFSLDNSFNRTNDTTITFLIDQPLLRNFIYNENYVNEVVSELELNAVKYELTQTMALNVRDALLLYWDLVAAQKILNVNNNAKEILEALASATERLVAGERVAASELNEQFAELARSNRDVVATKQDVFRTFNNLLFQMGTDRKKFPIDLPPLDLDAFPAFDVKKEDWNLDYLLQVSSKNRGDLIATQFRIEEADWQVRLAKQDIYPELNVQFGYDLFNTQINKKAKPFFASTETHKAQNDYTLMFSFSVPIFNNAAKGALKSRDAELSQTVLTEERLEEDIHQAVATAFREQLELIDQIYYARKSVEWYEKALSDEILRFKEGYGSLFIIIDFENRLRFTLIEEIQVLASWAKNIIELLFQTGTLIERNACTNEMEIDILNYKKLTR